MKTISKTLLAIAILGTLGYVVTVARDRIANGISSTATVIKSLDSHPDGTPHEKAAKKCAAFLMEYPNTEIVRVDVMANDTEWGANTAPLTVIVTVRIDGPMGKKKGVGIFGCDLDGNIVQLRGMPDYLTITKSAF